MSAPVDGTVPRTVRAYDLDAAAFAEGGARGGARLLEELGLSVRRTDITPAVRG